MLVKPRLGSRRCRGICPPSKPRIRLEPVRDPWPLCPRVEVLPMPDPIPRPTRLRPVLAFLGARKFERFFAMIFLAVAPERLIPPDSRCNTGIRDQGLEQQVRTIPYSLFPSSPESEPGAEWPSPYREWNRYRPARRFG